MSDQYRFLVHTSLLKIASNLVMENKKSVTDFFSTKLSVDRIVSYVNEDKCIT